MGPTVLITIGVLFLLSQATGVYWLRFHNTWPALLIVIGLIMFLQHNAPATGHVPREYMVHAAGTTACGNGSLQCHRNRGSSLRLRPQPAAPQQDAGTTNPGEVHNG